MLTIGLTGGIGTGKSEVSRILSNLGAQVIDADKVGHEAYKPGSPIWQEVLDAFGEGILRVDGGIDRKQLGSIVFNDPQALKKLNAIMHPRMADIIGQKVGQFREEGVEAVVLEAALLLEAGWDSLVDEIWIVRAPEDKVVERLKQRDKLPGGEIKERMRSQLAFEEASLRAQVVIHNSGDLAGLQREVKSSWDARLKGKVNKVG